jgi:hypothetical protein
MEYWSVGMMDEDILLRPSDKLGAMKDREVSRLRLKASPRQGGEKKTDARGQRTEIRTSAKDGAIQKAQS